MLDRQKILELYQKGFKISHIAKVIGVTHCMLHTQVIIFPESNHPHFKRAFRK
jgi:hypothetical protein